MAALSLPAAAAPAAAVSAAGATPASSISNVFSELRAVYDTGRTRSVAWRRSQLEAVRRLCQEGEAELMGALNADLRKCKMEALNCEINPVITGVREHLHMLDKVTRRERVAVPWALGKGVSAAFVERQPRGAVLIIAPWNFPLVLMLGPLLAALTAGNTVCIKPSEISASVSAAVARLVPRFLDGAAVRVVEGGVAETGLLLDQPWDHIFFTGAPAIGKVVLAAAAKHLTPCVLELGGKSPCYVDESADLDLAARRIAWGKSMNCGQICIAPDYVLAHAAVYEQLVEKINANWLTFYGTDPKSSPDYGRIVSDRHYKRVMRFIDDARANGTATIRCGGIGDPADRFIAPTILLNVDAAKAACMQEEIFGPVLPIIPVSSAAAARMFIAERPEQSPLAFYVFAKDRHTVQAMINGVQSGTACVNDILMQYACGGLPFGGVGNSGMGFSHGGVGGVEEFCNVRGVFDAAGAFMSTAWRFPPYDEGKIAQVRQRGLCY